ncbi:MAG: hypothetical protein J6T98_11550 [Salinivirgaceae bacterium]|nr:hypothetical protein [Salinivirgaceae bacterium]
MSTALEQVLLKFNAREATESTILDKFREIANVALYGGYFLVNGETRIYPIEIEFYLHGEREKEPNWMTDKKMIHRNGKDKVPYFPNTGSLFPHTFGVDVTFENEKEEYRASFLVRKYRYKKNGKTIANPTYLWEDIFGYNTFAGTGFVIKWIDEPSIVKDTITNTRLNLKGEDGKQDPKPWRFTKV